MVVKETFECFKLFFLNVYALTTLFFLFLCNFTQGPRNHHRGAGGTSDSAGSIHALQGLKGGKAPGIDRIPVEFYQEFWKELGRDLLMFLMKVLKT